jgi:hypothetical protein
MLMTAPAVRERPPPSAVKILLPVWGERFVAQFLEFCLPTLLAPGNIPAVAHMLPTEMVLMTSAADEVAIRRHPLWQKLAAVCSVAIKPIDDLITDGNHSTTITLAYARVVRESGDKMLDTCFIFLVSDYIVADGSISSVAARVMDGASGVLAGNFQVIAEDAVASLRQWLGPTQSPLALPPRKLTQWALSHLHPATVANIVNYRLSHNVHINRLFWRVDENTLIGRFYLMHMIAIRPEVTDFMVGSSCDYSFIPEMCPSGDVVALEDSDDYLVIEMQPRDHEARHLRWGPITPKFLAESLSEWTTTAHRQNIRHTIVYHVADIPDTAKNVMAEADAFVANVGSFLPASVQPHRDHPYWIGAIAAHRAATGQKLSPQEWDFVLGGSDNRRHSLSRLLWRARTKVYGHVLAVRPWHPRWADFRKPLSALRDVLGDPGELLIVSDAPGAFNHWLWSIGKPGRSMELTRLVNMPEADLKAAAAKYCGSLLVMSEGDISRADKLIRRIATLLQPSASLFILILNDRAFDPAAFGGAFAHHSARFVNLSMWVAETSYVRSGKIRWALRRRLARLARRSTGLRWYHLPHLVIVGGFLSVVNCLCDVVAWRATPDPPRRGICSSAFLVLRPTAGFSKLPSDAAACSTSKIAHRADAPGATHVPSPSSL